MEALTWYMFLTVILVGYMLLVNLYGRRHNKAMIRSKHEHFKVNEGFVIMLGICTVLMLIVIVGLYIMLRAFT